MSKNKTKKKDVIAVLKGRIFLAGTALGMAQITGDLLLFTIARVVMGFLGVVRYQIKK